MLEIPVSGGETSTTGPGKRNRFHSYFVFVLAVGILLLALSSKASAWAPSSQPDSIGLVLTGFAGGLALHESAHFFTVWTTGGTASWDGFAITYDTTRLSRSQHLWSASAGTLSQWALTEGIFAGSGKTGPGDLGAGAILSEVLTAGAYATFLYKNKQGDVEGMSNATGVNRVWITAGLVLPATMDAWRLFAKESPPIWVPALSCLSKGLALVWIATF